MRFDLEKWLRVHHNVISELADQGYCLYDVPIKYGWAQEAIAAAEAALLAPSPCGVEGHRMCNWVEEVEPITRFEAFTPEAKAAFPIRPAALVRGHCRRCQELSRVSERTKELREALDRLAKEVSGILSLERDGLRKLISNTNVAVLEHWLDAARAILKKSDPTPSARALESE